MVPAHWGRADGCRPDTSRERGRGVACWLAAHDLGHTARMNKTRLLSRLLELGAVLEIPVGLGLLAAPSPLASLLLGESLSGAGLVVARLAGGALLGLGIACWLVRSTPTARAGLGVVAALLIYNVAACVTLATAASGPGIRALILGAAVLHGLLAAGLLGALSMREHQLGAQLER